MVSRRRVTSAEAAASATQFVVSPGSAPRSPPHSCVSPRATSSGLCPGPKNSAASANGKPCTTPRPSTCRPSSAPLENRAGVMRRGAGNACSPSTRIVRGRITGPWPPGSLLPAIATRCPTLDASIVAPLPVPCRPARAHLSSGLKQSVRSGSAHPRCPFRRPAEKLLPYPSGADSECALRFERPRQRIAADEIIRCISGFLHGRFVGPHRDRCRAVVVNERVRSAWFIRFAGALGRSAGPTQARIFQGPAGVDEFGRSAPAP